MKSPRELLVSHEKLSLAKHYLACYFGVFSGSGTSMSRIFSVLLFNLCAGEPLQAEVWVGSCAP